VRAKNGPGAVCGRQGEHLRGVGRGQDLDREGRLSDRVRRFCDHLPADRLAAHGQTRNRRGGPLLHHRHVAVHGDQGRQVGEALRRGVRQRGEEPELGSEADGGAVLVREVGLTAGQRGPDGAIKRMRHRA